MKLSKLLSCVATTGLWLALQSGALAGAASVTLEDARSALEKSSAVVIDVREPGEHTNGVAKGALLIPMGQVEQRLSAVAPSKTQPIILLCATQNRSARLADKLRAVGYSQISYAQGGMSQWSSRGWPMIKP